MARIRWTGNARGFYLDLSRLNRDLLGKQIGHLERFPLLGQRDRSSNSRRLLRVRRYGVLYSYEADQDVITIISIRPLSHA